MDFAVGFNSVVAHASGRTVGTDQVGLCHFQLPHCIGRLAVRLFSVPLPVSTNAMDRAREAGLPACPLLVVRLGRNAGCHLVLDVSFPPFRLIPRDILKKIRQVEICTNRIVTGLSR